MANGITADTTYESYLTKKGFKSWALTTDHKRIGIMYLISISFFFLLAGVTALLMRFELLTPELDFFRNTTEYNVAFTLHGSLMVFFFIVPGIAASFG
ncbi:MAG: cbb3-type cytochrome c oxidase subunit I, partial [Thermodesulfobacteriota bacterium]